MTEHPVTDHWQGFYEFCYYEHLAGGPDPHMACVAEVGRQAGLDRAGLAWLGALYASVYNVPTALVLHHRFPTPAAVEELDAMAWLTEHWAGIALRRERKAVRSPEKLARCLASWAAFCRPHELEARLHHWYMLTEDRYEVAFDEVCTVYGVGRYIGQKWIEYARRYCDAAPRVNDVRARDGWSPREALALLYPQRAALLTEGGDSPDVVAAVEAIAAELRTTLDDLYELPPHLDFYELQVLLCDYKQSAVGQRQYPGRSQDSEIEYDAKIAPHWGARQEAMYAARAAIFPHWALGELSGWSGVRKDLGKVLARHRYTWSDSLYSWEHSRADLANPVPR